MNANLHTARRGFLRASRGAVVALLGAAFVVSTAAQTTTPAGTKKQRVVIQMSDGDSQKWNLALNNAKNIQEDLGAANVEVEIITYGPGLGMLLADATTANRVTDAVKAGIKVYACQNTMRGMKLSAADMNPAVGYVPSGATAIMKRQTEGWAYLRP
jgi:intracellular sulfur oxidation DsrE/DsrF family protein